MNYNPETQNNEPVDKGMRLRISIPPDDKAVIAWMNAQHDRSMSIRMIIRDAIERYGMRDFFATSEGEIQQRNTPGPKPNSVRRTDSEKAAKQPSDERARAVMTPEAKPRVPSNEDEANAAQVSLQSMLDM